MTGSPPAFNFHPARSRLLGEAHARPPITLTSKTQIARLSFLNATDKGDADRLFLDALCARLGETPPAPDARHCSLSTQAATITWERHTEFSTYTIAPAQADASASEAADAAELAETYFSGAPGELFSATLVAVMKSAGQESDFAAAREYYGHDDFIASSIAGGAFMAMTDYRADARGFVRFILFDLAGEASPGHRGRAAQRLLETETYRLAALLGFVLARDMTPELERLHEAMEELTTRLAASPHVGRDRELLSRAAQISGEIELMRARTRHRFGATRAYQRIVLERIERLREEVIPGRQRLGSFLEMRLAPAMRTCEAMAKQQDELGDQLNRAMQLLATRVNVAVEEQSSRLLTSMDERARLQLRLQETVEGLSVVAVSYYAVGLVYYAARALSALGAPLEPSLVAGIATPIVIATAWLGIRRLRKRIMSDN